MTRIREPNLRERLDAIEEQKWDTDKEKFRAIENARTEAEEKQRKCFEFEHNTVKDDVPTKEKFTGILDKLEQGGKSENSNYEYVVLELAHDGSGAVVYPCQILRFIPSKALENTDPETAREAQELARIKAAKQRKEKMKSKKKLLAFAEGGLREVQTMDAVDISEIRGSLKRRDETIDLKSSSKRYKKTRERGMQEDLPDCEAEFSDDEEGTLGNNDLFQDAEEDELSSEGSADEDGFLNLEKKVEDYAKNKIPKAKKKKGQKNQDSSDEEAFKWDRVGISDSEGESSTESKVNGKQTSSKRSRPSVAKQPPKKKRKRSSNSKELNKEYVIRLFFHRQNKGITSKAIFDNVKGNFPKMNIEALKPKLSKILKEIGTLMLTKDQVKLWFLKSEYL